MTTQYNSGDQITTEIRKTVIKEVAEGGWLEETLSDAHADYLAAWVPLEARGELHTTSILERPQGKEQPTWVRSDGDIKIGPGDEWGGRRVAIFILDETKGDDVEVWG